MSIFRALIHAIFGKPIVIDDWVTIKTKGDLKRLNGRSYIVRRITENMYGHQQFWIDDNIFFWRNELKLV